MVDEFASTFSGMMRLLRNENMVRSFSKEGAMLKVLVELTPSYSTVSGYEWTSSEGPQMKISAGALVKALFVVKTYSPFELLLPWMSFYVRD